MSEIEVMSGTSDDMLGVDRWEAVDMLSGWVYAGPGLDWWDGVEVVSNES